MKGSAFSYLNQEEPGEEILALIGEIPKRWGRMDRASRLAVVEIGRLLQAQGLTVQGQWRLDSLVRVGLVAATRYGSLASDLGFLATMRPDPAQASPMLFGYTLPNIALAEAASHFGIIGPVYAIFAADLWPGALAEARRWLACDPALTHMIAGVLDAGLEAGTFSGCDAEPVTAQFQLLSKP